MSKDLFAPPSEDELQMFAPPSPEEMGEPSQLSALGLGAAQGLTFGAADEMEAAVRSALSGELTKEQYDNKLSEIRLRYKAAQEAHPITTFAGELGGGILLPGFGIGKGAITAGKAIGAGALAGGLAGLGTSEKDLLGGDFAGAAEDVATGVVAGGITGGLVPAAAAIGGAAKKTIKDTSLVKNFLNIIEDASKGTIHSGEGVLKQRVDNVRNVAKDVIDVAAKLKRQAGEAIEAPITKATEKGMTSDVSDILNIFKQQGPILDKATAKDFTLLEDVTNKAMGRGDIADVERAVTKEATEYIQKQRHKLMQLSDALESADSPEASEVINSQISTLMDDIASLTNFVSGRESMTDMPVGSREMLSKIFVKASKDIGDYNPMKSPSDIRAIEKRLNAVYDNLDSPQGKELLGQLKGSLREKMFSGADPELKEEYLDAMKKYGGTMDVLDERKLAEGFGLGGAGSEVTRQKQLFDMIKSLSSDKSKEGSFGRQFFDRLKDIDPEKAAGLEKRIGKASKKLELTSSMYTESPFAEASLTGLLPSGKAAVTRTGEWIGRAIGAVDKAATGTQKLATEMPKKILNALDRGDSEYISNLANKVRDLNTATSVDLYNKLTSLSTMPPNRQKTTIFVLQQQPQYRELFNAITPDIEGDEE